MSRNDPTHLRGGAGAGELGREAAGRKGAPAPLNYTKMLSADSREPIVFGKTARFRMRKGDVSRLITGGDLRSSPSPRLTSERGRADHQLLRGGA